MIIKTDDFITASAAYGSISHSKYNKTIYFESDNPVISLFNYVKEKPLTSMTVDLHKIHNSKYNLLCWSDLVSESKKHMEELKPDYTANFSIPQRVASTLKARTRKLNTDYNFIPIFDLPDYKGSIEAEDFLLCSSKECYEQAYSAIRVWGMQDIKLVFVDEVSVETIKLSNSPQCKGFVGFADSWIVPLACKGYYVVQDTPKVKPFFFSDLNRVNLNTSFLGINIQWPDSYITLKYETYKNMVKYNYDHVKYLRALYAKTDP